MKDYYKEYCDLIGTPSVSREEFNKYFEWINKEWVRSVLGTFHTLEECLYKDSIYLDFDEDLFDIAKRIRGNKIDVFIIIYAKHKIETLSYGELCLLRNDIKEEIDWHRFNLQQELLSEKGWDNLPQIEDGPYTKLDTEKIIEEYYFEWYLNSCFLLNEIADAIRKMEYESHRRKEIERINKEFYGVPNPNIILEEECGTEEAEFELSEIERFVLDLAVKEGLLFKEGNRYVYRKTKPNPKVSLSAIVGIMPTEFHSWEDWNKYFNVKGLRRSWDDIVGGMPGANATKDEWSKWCGELLWRKKIQSIIKELDK